MDSHTDGHLARVLRKQVSRASWWEWLAPYGSGALVTTTALLVALLIKTHLVFSNVTLIFLAGVVFTATRWGLKPALLAAALSVLALNFFFFLPLHDFAVEGPEDILTVVIFFGVAAFVGRLTARARADAALAERRAAITEELYDLSRRLTSVHDLSTLVEVTAQRIAVAIDVETVLLFAGRDGLVVRAGVPLLGPLDPTDAAAAEVCLNDSHRVTGDGEPMADPMAASYLFLPLSAARGTVGVIGVRRNDRPPLLASDGARLLQAMIDQTAVAMERLTLAADVEQARVTAETEGLRSAMLSAISHDLKTPLASILGAATSLGSYSSYFEQQQREELVATIREEAERMSSFIANLLDITRVESGTLSVEPEATDIEDVIGAAARRVKRILGSHRLTLRVAPDLPMLRLDGVLLEQTLFNLIDNAAKYSPPESAIVIEARRINARVVIKVIDEGPGIPPLEQKLIFEKFYRSGPRGRQGAGTGLGLAICRGFVEAMGGRIIAGNRTDRSGAVIMIGFPLPRLAELPRLPEGDDD